MESRKKLHRVSKIDKRKSKGRGRPQAYSESWKKKVVVLRSCGLDLKDILELLARPDGVAFKAKVRRSQQIVQELLTDRNERFTPPEKEIACSLAGIIRASRPRRKKLYSTSTVPRKINSISSAANISSPDLTDQDASSEYGNEAILQVEGLSLHVIEPGLKQMSQSDPDTEESNKSTAGGSFNQSFSLGSTADTVAARTRNDPEEALNNVFDIGKQLLTKEELRATIRRLSNASFGSSFLSDLVSLIGRRYSCSTFDSTERSSLHPISEPATDCPSLEDKVKKVLKIRLQEDILENTALIQRCCSHENLCIHKAIKMLAENDIESRDLWWNNFLDVYQSSSPLIDFHKNDTLFFAARVGAPADVLLYLTIRATDSGFVNRNGQTWLHCLDPRRLMARICICEYSSAHSSTFECVTKCIYPPSRIDRIDDHGRHFLFYVCSSLDFDLGLLEELVHSCPEWEERIVFVSQIRDREGLFLWDYVATHPTFPTLSEGMQSLIRPKFDSASYPLRILLGEGEKGRSALHSVMDSITGPNIDFLSPYPGAILQQLNRYDDTGHTPLMTVIEKAFEHDEQDEVLCNKVRTLASWGANIDARSRSGATVLHFAAQKASVQLLHLLLDDLSARVDVYDDKGLSPADYVAKAIRLSQTANRSAAVLARSIKSAGKILTFQSNQKNKSTSHGLSAADAEAQFRVMLQSLPQPVPYNAQPVMDCGEFIQVDDVSTHGSRNSTTC